MERSEIIEIPFGAKDSELKGWKYTIPEGMKARIEGNKIILEPKESEDERIRKALMQNLKERFGTKGNMGKGLDMPDVIAWLEKQGSQNLTNSGKTCKVGQNPAWSEEDERLLYNVKAYVDYAAGQRGVKDELFKEANEWLKSLKERVQPGQDLHPRYIEGKGIYVPIIDVVLNMQDEPKEMTWDEAKDIALSKEQMFVVLYYKDEINALLEKYGGQKLEGWHWTSTQYSGDTNAWTVYFYNSYVIYNPRPTEFSVRAFSAYHPESYIFKNLKG